MRTPLLSAALAAFPLMLTAQTATVDWIYTFGDTHYDGVNRIQIDAAGNSYTAGTYTGACDFDPGPGNTTIFTQVETGYLQKLDPDGNLIWVKTFDDPVIINVLFLASDGSLYYGGRFTEMADIDPGPGFFTLTANGNKLYIAKLDSSGDFLWGESFGGDQYQTLSDIAIDADGNLLLNGVFEGIQCDFNPGPAISNLNAAGGRDCYILKLDPNGGFIWAERIGGPNFDWTSSLTTDDESNVYITGSFQSTVDFNPGSGSHLLQAEGNADGFLLKLNDAGNYVWAKSFSGSSIEVTEDLTIDPAGNLYLTGWFNSPDTDLDPNAGTHIVATESDPDLFQDLFVVKLTASGDFTWGETFGHSGGSVSSTALTVSPENNLLIAGSHSVSFDADPGSGTTTFTEHSAGAFVLLLNANGDYIWNASFAQVDTTNSDIIFFTDLAFDASGGFYITGTYEGMFDADPGPGETILTSNGDNDAFLMKQQFVLGIGDQENTIGAIWPNPFSATVTIKLDQPLERASVTITGMDGQTVRTLQDISGTEIGLKREQLPAGVYLIRIQEGERTIATERIVVID